MASAGKGAPGKAPEAEPAAAAYVLPALGAIAHAAFLVNTYFTTFSGQSDPIPMGSGETFWERLMNNPVLPWQAPAFLTAGYIAMVFLGPHLMREKPFDVRAAFRVYNIYITLLSAAMLLLLGWDTAFARILSGQVTSITDFWAIPLERSNNRLAFALWVNYQSKFFEYLDTVWMIARRKFDQVSFLHWQHHALMGPLMWIVVVSCPGGTSYFGPMLNAFVHTVMYIYFTATSLPLSDGARKGWNRMKPYVTSLQMTQFVIITGHAVFNYFVAPGKYWPSQTALIELFLMFDMLALFGEFFYKSYVSGAKKKAAAAAAKELEGKKA